ncbi:MAG: hypothetical protein MJ210_02970, partial [Alphaproteobacteria bacterium]|nr:hypothetical protein [Alphaproteobacteria bacterium]
CVLPVFGFIALVPALIYVDVLITLLIECFPQCNNFTLPVLPAFAAVSLIVGALSANYEKNLRCLTAFITIFCIGTTIIGLSDFSRTAITASFAYILVAVLSLSGIFTVFLGMKSRSEFLSDLSSVSGFSKLRPYMSATLLVCIFSLIGLSPTVGFLGYLSIYSNFIEQESWRKIALIMIGNLFIAASGLKIIKTIYFEPLNNKYDRTDKAIYICLFIDMALLLISLFKPSWLMRDILIILGGMS